MPVKSCAACAAPRLLTDSSGAFGLHSATTPVGYCKKIAHSSSRHMLVSCPSHQRLSLSLNSSLSSLRQRSVSQRMCAAQQHHVTGVDIIALLLLSMPALEFWTASSPPSQWTPSARQRRATSGSTASLVSSAPAARLTGGPALWI